VDEGRVEADAGARSAAMLKALDAAGGWGGGRLQIDFSIPLFFADGATPRQTITSRAAEPYCYRGPDCEPVPLQMPMPAGGNTEAAATIRATPAHEERRLRPPWLARRLAGEHRRERAALRRPPPLKATFDETKFNAGERAILHAMKTYGMLLSDGGTIALTFADDRTGRAKWQSVGVTALSFSAIKVDDFDVVDLPVETALTDDCVRNP